MRIYFLISVCIMALFWSCGENLQTESGTNKTVVRSNVDGARILAETIDSLENVVFVSDAAIDEHDARELLKAYEKYASRYGGDAVKGPEYLYKAAAVNRGLNNPLEAILIYDRILTKYPDYERNPEVAFLTGFTYEADLREPERAKEAYAHVIELYPDDKWAIEAKSRLQTIDMTDEELIKSFKEKNKSNS